MEIKSNKTIPEKSGYTSIVVNGNQYCVRRQSDKGEQLSEIIKYLLLQDISKNPVLKCSFKDDMIIS